MSEEWQMCSSAVQSPDRAVTVSLWSSQYGTLTLCDPLIPQHVICGTGQTSEMFGLLLIIKSLTTLIAKFSSCKTSHLENSVVLRILENKVSPVITRGHTFCTFIIDLITLTAKHFGKPSCPGAKAQKMLVCGVLCGWMNALYSPISFWKMNCPSARVLSLKSIWSMISLFTEVTCICLDETQY